LTGCDKIEALLWEKAYGTISEEDNELLRQHLADCADCRKIQSTIEALGVSRRADEEFISGIGADEFESSVMRKIRARESELRFKRDDKGYMVRMYFSVGLAAAIVAFIVISMGDLERFVIPTKPAAYNRVNAPKQYYDTFHIELQPGRTEEPPEPAGRVSMERGEESREKAEPSAIQPSQEESGAELEESDVAKLFEKEQKAEVPEPAPRLLTIIPKEKAEPEAVEKKKAEVIKPDMHFDFRSANEQQPGALTARRMKGISEVTSDLDVGQFQILNQPVTNPAPDSVEINSIYLIDESIPFASQQTRAYLPQVRVDSGSVQSVETPRSVLVTVEKMPIPVKIIPPEYPVWARKNGISGTVWVKAHVNDDGDVVEAEIESSSNPGYGFEEASLEAAKQCKYLPAEANGFKIGVWVIYPVNFVFNAEDIK